MMSILIAAIFAFFITTLFGHCMHWILHQRWSGWLYDAHQTHHMKLYPPSDFVSKIYRQAGKDSTPKFFLISGAPLIIVPIILWYFGILSLSIMITVLVVEGLIGFLHNYLHDAFHIEGHWLYRVYAVRRFFAHLTSLHYLHHVDTTKNYLIIFSFWDRVFGTYTNYVQTKQE
jgi:sterol desaturase/sphingolipid hydroxylase (fatty acid hydroxylase superfamily)